MLSEAGRLLSRGQRPAVLCLALRQVDATRQAQWQKLTKLSPADMEALLNLELMGVPINPKPATGRLGLTLSRRRNRTYRKASTLLKICCARCSNKKDDQGQNVDHVSSDCKCKFDVCKVARGWWLQVLGKIGLTSCVSAAARHSVADAAATMRHAGPSPPGVRA
jgi:hypothetical protein